MVASIESTCWLWHIREKRGLLVLLVLCGLAGNISGTRALVLLGVLTVHQETGRLYGLHLDMIASLFWFGECSLQPTSYGLTVGYFSPNGNVLLHSR